MPLTLTWDSDDPQVAEALAAEVEHLRGAVLADGLVIVKYTSTNAGARTHRTSLWRRIAPGRWQIFHHQGTPASQLTDDAVSNAPAD